jgi:hypothetical protein
MQEENKNARPDSFAQQGEATAKDERFAEATSSETLHDVRTEEKLSSGDSSTREANAIAAPDVNHISPSSSSERADGSDTGEPM